MKTIISLCIFLFFVFNLALGQSNKKVAQGEPDSKKMISRQVKKGGDEIPQNDFDYGVKEFDFGNFRTSLKNFNMHLIANPDDFTAYSNRGLTYYFLEDIEHACMDWKYAAYFKVYEAKRNYLSVCDTSFDIIPFLNGGILVRPPVYDEKFEANKVETPPSFPGGEEELNKFLRKNLNISQSLRSTFLKSRILVRFKVMEDGTVSNPVVMEKDKSELTAEAIRLTSMMTKWKPAIKKGSPVATEMYYPVINGIDSIRKANKIYNDGVKLIEQSDFQNALLHFTQAIKINEADDDAYYNRGICHLKLGDTANACLDWNRSSLRSYYSVVNLLNKYCNANISHDDIPSINVTNQTVYTIVQSMPSFPDGEEAMLNYISKNIKYPNLAKENNISGRVYVSFVIDKEGYVRDPKILRGIGGGCDEEALRVVKEMPQWTPGTQNDRPVNVQYNLPINFALKGRKK